MRKLEGAAFAAPRPARGLFCNVAVLITGLWFKAYEFVNGDGEVEFDVEDLSCAVCAIVEEGDTDPAVGCLFGPVGCVGDVNAEIGVPVTGPTGPKTARAGGVTEGLVAQKGSSPVRKRFTRPLWDVGLMPPVSRTALLIRLRVWVVTAHRTFDRSQAAASTCHALMRAPRPSSLMQSVRACANGGRARRRGGLTIFSR